MTTYNNDGAVSALLSTYTQTEGNHDTPDGLTITETGQSLPNQGEDDENGSNVCCDYNVIRF